MKLTFKQIEPFVKSPDASARAILVYGPDDGLMRERSKIMAQTVVEDLNDAFNVVTLSGSDLVEEGGKLYDEAMATSLMGGSRVVFIEQASDKNTVTLKEYLESPSDDNLVIVQAGDLGPRSSLRGLFEKQKNAAAVPCYVEEGQSLAYSIQDHMRDNGLQIDMDAVQYLAQNLVGDRAQMRSELDKLVTYMGTDNKQVKIEDAMNNTGALSEQKIDALVYACAGGQTPQAEALLNGLLDEGTSEVAILRSLQMHFRKLLLVKVQMENGMNVDAAIKTLQPPLFWKLTDPFKNQLRKWPVKKLLLVMKKINDLEMDMKKTETPAHLTLTRSIFGLSQMGR